VTDVSDTSDSMGRSRISPRLPYRSHTVKGIEPKLEVPTVCFGVPNGSLGKSGYSTLDLALGPVGILVLSTTTI
jgi:hypothetical protein